MNRIPPLKPVASDDRREEKFVEIIVYPIPLLRASLDSRGETHRSQIIPIFQLESSFHTINGVSRARNGSDRSNSSSRRVRSTSAMARAESSADEARDTRERDTASSVSSQKLDQFLVSSTAKYCLALPTCPEYRGPLPQLPEAERNGGTTVCRALAAFYIGIPAISNLREAVVSTGAQFRRIFPIGSLLSAPTRSPVRLLASPFSRARGHFLLYINCIRHAIVPILLLR